MRPSTSTRPGPGPSLAFLAAVAALSVPQIALAQHAGKGRAPDDGDQPAAVQAAVDPKSGKVRAPTREEVKALLEAAGGVVSQSAEGLSVVRRPDGVRYLDLEGRFESVSLAKIEDGEVRTGCVTTPQEARRFLEGPSQPAPAAPAKLEEE